MQELRWSSLPFHLLKALQFIKIDTLTTLINFGSVKTYLLLQANGYTYTRRVLFLLESVVLNTNLSELDFERRSSLIRELKQHTPVKAFPSKTIMEEFMSQAICQADLAARYGEVPIGAVVVYQNQVVSEGFNHPRQNQDPSAHAEIVALKVAAQRLQNYRLVDCDLYVTLEPCIMCAGAIIQARINRLIFGAKEPKTGVVGSVINVFDNNALNKHTAVIGGVCEKDCQTVLQTFFQSKRGKLCQ